MHRQVGDLQTDDKGVAMRGLILCHLVMPWGLAGTARIMAYIHDEISPGTHVNIMSQYRPMGMAHRTESLSREITPDEYHEALDAAKKAGIVNFL